MEALGALFGGSCLIGCVIGLVLAPILAVVIYVGRNQAKRKAWDIIRRGTGSEAEIDGCIKMLTGAQDAESTELIRRLVAIKAGER